MVRVLRFSLAILAVAIVVGWDRPAEAQAVCRELEAELLSLREPVANGNTRAIDRRIRQLVNTVNRDQREARAMGCVQQGLGMFRQQAPAACRPLIRSIMQQRAEYDQLMAQRNRAAGWRSRDPRRERRILAALAANGCGQQYARYAAATRGAAIRPVVPQQRGTFRTLCVRTCDGYYWPVSFSTTPDNFRNDALACEQSCPKAEVELYLHPMPDGKPEDMTSLANGGAYTALPTAFRYRREVTEGCTCGAVEPPRAEEEGRVAVVALRLGDAENVDTAEGVIPLPRPNPAWVARNTPTTPFFGEGNTSEEDRIQTRQVRVVGPQHLYLR